MLRYAFDPNHRARQPNPTIHVHEDAKPVLPRDRTEEFQRQWDDRVPKSQEQSMFCAAIPAEVRLQVYQHALTGHTFVLRCQPRWVKNNSEYQELTGRRKGFLDKLHPVNRSYVGLMKHRKAKNMFALPLTCRRLYEECLDVIYQANTFVVSSEFYCWQSSKDVVKVSQLLNTRMLQGITQLQVTLSWSKLLPKCSECQGQHHEFWTSLLSFKGLRKLRIVSDFYSLSFKDEHLRFLGPTLQQLSHLEVVELYIPTGWESMQWQFGDPGTPDEVDMRAAPFRLVPRDYNSRALWPAFDETSIGDIGLVKDDDQLADQ